MIIEKVNDYRYKIPKQGNMKTDAYVFASEKLLKKMKEGRTLEQLMNVASLPSVLDYPSVMPDAHEGYGFPIGGVAAFENIVSPGGVGFDINCGVRLLNTNLDRENVKPKIKDLAEMLFKNIPAGLGEGNIRVNESELEDILRIGVKWAYEKGYAYARDLDRIEENGRMDGIPEYISKTAKGRGKNQLGSLGSGNHFLEVQYVEEIYDERLAKVFNIEEGKVMVMIHTGSRGLGHQIASDYIAEIVRKNRDIPDLAYAYIDDEIGQRYFGAMKSAVNFAFTNRQIITYLVRETFYDIFRIDNIELVYDVAHNIAKIEKHKVGGEWREVIVHRKGATRSFPPYHQDIPPAYREVGQPVLIPGSMGTASYLLVGDKNAMDVSFGSTCHGAGRSMSRTSAKKNYRVENVVKDLLKKGIIIKARSEEGVVEEVPDAYKNVDDVVDTVVKNGLSRVVARLRPMIVIKG